MAGQTTVTETLLVAIQDTIKVCTNAFGPQSALVHDLGDLTAALKDLSFPDASFQKPAQGSGSRTLQDGSLQEALFNCLDAVSKARRLARHIARGHYRESDIPREKFDKIKQFAVYFSGLVKLDPRFDGAITNRSSEDSYTEDRQQQSDPWRGELVLSLDGGGVRGFATLILLEELRNAIAEEESRDPQVLDSYSSPLFQTSRSTPRHEELAKRRPSAKRNPDVFRLCHYFDYICGSSFGGMAAVMLGVMRCTVGETIDHNRDIWRTTIHTTSKFLVPIPIPSLQLPNKARNSIDMRSSLQSTFKERISVAEGSEPARTGHMHRTAVTPTLSTLDGRCQTIVFAIHEASDGRVRPYAFRSYSLSSTEQLHSRSRSKPGLPDAGPNTSSVSVVDACLATSAVPSLYRKVKIPELEGSFVDGGVWRTNPAEEVYRELQIRHQSARPPVRALLSIGGRPALQESRRQREPLARAIDRIDDLIHDEKTRFDDFLQVRQRNQELKYDRLLCETTTKASVHIERMLDSIEQEARAFVKADQKTQKVLRSWAGFLVKTRQQRSRTARWAEYAGLKVPHVERELPSTKPNLPISRQDEGIDARLRSALPVSAATFR